MCHPYQRLTATMHASSVRKCSARLCDMADIAGQQRRMQRTPAITDQQTELLGGQSREWGLSPSSSCFGTHWVGPLHDGQQEQKLASTKHGEAQLFLKYALTGQQAGPSTHMILNCHIGCMHG